ncbi:hypothetical protein PQX77_007852 [Marasmius sp. AFHP31]|nr:hypothetical protein PQX77_007852 [Marasmius sp. AFHP31]
MAGANYMGGKRNAAKSRAKDKTTRTQKRFFGQRRLNLATQRLTERKGPESMKPLSSTRSIPDISLSHARKHQDPLEDDIAACIPPPNHIVPCSPTSEGRLKDLNKENSSSSSGKTSKVLEAIDTTEPASMRAAMDRILALPDLAGISNQPQRVKSSKQSKRRLSPALTSPMPKRRKVISPLPPSSEPRSILTSSPTLAFADESEEIGQMSAYSDSSLWTGVDVERETDGENGHDDGVLPTRTLTPCHQCTFATDAVSGFPAATMPVEELLKYQSSTSSTTPDSKDVEWSYDDLTLTPASRNTSAVAHSPLRRTGLKPKFSFSGNVLDYEDPWKAVGLVLGLEKPPHSPLRPRNFTAILAQIPSPDPSVAQFSSPCGLERVRDSLFSCSVSPLDDDAEQVTNDEDAYTGSCLPVSQVHDTSLPTTRDMPSIRHRMSSPRSPTSLFSCYSALEPTESVADVPVRDASAYEKSPDSSAEDYDHDFSSHDIEGVQIDQEAGRDEALESEGTSQGSPDKGSSLYAEESDTNGTNSPDNATANQYAAYGSIKDPFLADEYAPTSPFAIPVPRLADHTHPAAGHFDFASARPSSRTPHVGLHRATRKSALTPTFDNVTPQEVTLRFPRPPTPLRQTPSSKHSISKINPTFDRSNTSVDLQSSLDCYVHIPSPSLPPHSRTLQPSASTSSNPRDEQRAVNSSRPSPVIQQRVVLCSTSLDHCSSPSSPLTNDSIIQQPALSTLYRPQDASIACASVDDGIMDASGSTSQLQGSPRDCKDTNRDISVDLTGTAITFGDVGLWKGPNLFDDEDVESD